MQQQCRRPAAAHHICKVGELQPTGLAEAQQALHTAVAKGDVARGLVAGSGQHGKHAGQHLQSKGESSQAGRQCEGHTKGQGEASARQCQLSSTTQHNCCSTHFPQSPRTSTHLAA